MKVEVKKRARNTLIKTAAWVEDQNTLGASNRWLHATTSEISSIVTSNVSLALCKDPKLSKFKYRYFTYKDK